VRLHGGVAVDHLVAECAGGVEEDVDELGGGGELRDGCGGELDGDQVGVGDVAGRGEKAREVLVLTPTTLRMSVGELLTSKSWSPL
jgi:hypothetical protein